ncbi:surface-adhesin E family protein [Sphingomonas sp.]|uniref:surface-adhesin E family protein n=1 Tax=Sphingomonas sp. TaxID=28214 RepID=UPI001EC40C0D|nr:surface-adhesin E family protein [Sphingomonas sp.]MBX3595273.1 hypothetical protein [Sphingomonas sp.]
MNRAAMFSVIAPSLLFSSAAEATTWKAVSVGSNGSLWYIDTDSMRMVSDGYKRDVIKVWVKTDYSAVKSVPEREVKQLIYVDCSQDSYKLISVIKYRSDGSVMNSFTPSYSSYEPIAPETVLSGVLETVCKQ